MASSSSSGSHHRLVRPTEIASKWPHRNHCASRRPLLRQGSPWWARPRVVRQLVAMSRMDVTGGSEPCYCVRAGIVPAARAWLPGSRSDSQLAPIVDTPDTTGCLCTIGYRKLGRRRPVSSKPTGTRQRCSGGDCSPGPRPEPAVQDSSPRPDRPAAIHLMTKGTHRRIMGP
jgi:hypothetical protein